MAILIIHPGKKATSWKKRILAMEPVADVREWPDGGDPDEIEFVLTWNHPHGELARYKHLKCIASMGAGVDHILNDPELPRNVPVTRIVDRSMAQSMSEYVVMCVLNWCRQTRDYYRNESGHLWGPKIPKLARKECVGIMGLGFLGEFTAWRLDALGFQVRGWRNNGKRIAGMETFCGQQEMAPFLEKVTVLVCMLPLTPETRGILNHRTFARLKPGAFVINVARGEHLNETDLLESLNAGQLSGACLDVFQTEPLPEDHPFWQHPDITVTPHISSLTNPAEVVPQIVENYRRMLSEKPLLNQVDPRKGY